MNSLTSIEERTRAALDGSAFVAWMLPMPGARKQISGGRHVEHRGVQALAEHMGLSAGHVCRVLRGERQSRKVLEAARTSGLVVSVERMRQ